MPYHSEFSQEFSRIFRKLDTGKRNELMKAINKILQRPEDGKSLRYNFKGLKSKRFEHYRIIYKIQDTTVFFITFEHRKDVYD